MRCSLRVSSFFFFTAAQLISHTLYVTLHGCLKDSRRFGRNCCLWSLRVKFTEFLFLFRWVSGFIGPQGITMLSLISNYTQKVINVTYKRQTSADLLCSSISATNSATSIGTIFRSWQSHSCHVMSCHVAPLTSITKAYN